MEPTYKFDAITCDYATIEEEEQKIYNMPDEDQDYGPIYTNPPTEEEEIYEIFKGNNINKLHHKNIRYHVHFILLH